VRVVPSKSRGSGPLRAKQVERILSGDEPRDHVSAFLTAMIQDLRDLSRAEIPSSVAAQHLLKMRLATEMGEAGPEPLLEAEEPVLPPPRPLERRRPTVAALGLAAAMVVMIGIAASITLPRIAGTRAGGVVRSDVPPTVVENGPGGLDRSIANDLQTADVRGCGITRLSALSISLASEVAPVLPQWPPLCPSSLRDVNPQSVITSRGPAAGQPLATVVTGVISAGAIDGSNSMTRSGDGPGGPRGSVGADTRSGTGTGSGNNPGSGGGSGSGENPAGGGTGGTTDPRPNAKWHGKGRDDGGGHGGDDGPRTSGHT
jgi:hypothetical protein